MSDTEGISPDHNHHLLQVFAAKLGGVSKPDINRSRWALVCIARHDTASDMAPDDVGPLRAVATQARSLVSWLMAGIEFPTVTVLRKNPPAEARVVKSIPPPGNANMLAALQELREAELLLPLREASEFAKPAHLYDMMQAFALNMRSVHCEEMQTTRRLLEQLARPFPPQHREELEPKRAVMERTLQMVDWLMAGIQFPTGAALRKINRQGFYPNLTKILIPPPPPRPSLLAVWRAEVEQDKARAEARKEAEAAARIEAACNAVILQEAKAVAARNAWGGPCQRTVGHEWKRASSGRPEPA
ncbi:MAG: hypothetical protein JSS43_18280 [Proteobacteria bacterium]|nr:hypothetical protein [Pseudomonadota bacterium]